MTVWVSFGKIVCNFSESKAFGSLLHKTVSLLDGPHFYAAKPGVANTLRIRRQGRILLPPLILGIPAGGKQSKRGWPCQRTPALFWWFSSNPLGRSKLKKKSPLPQNILAALAELAPSLFRELCLSSTGPAPSPTVMGSPYWMAKGGDPYTAVTPLPVHFPQ